MCQTAYTVADDDAGRPLTLCLLKTVSSFSLITEKGLAVSFLLNKKTRNEFVNLSLGTVLSNMMIQI